MFFSSLFFVTVISVIFAGFNRVAADESCTQTLQFFFRDAVNTVSGDVHKIEPDSISLIGLTFQTKRNADYFAGVLKNRGGLREFVSKGDALDKILRTNQIVVATYHQNWAGAGDYTKDEPTGFYPDYLTAVVNAMSDRLREIGLKNDSTNIQIVYKNYSKPSEIFPDLWDGKTDMTANYFLTGSLSSVTSQPLLLYFDLVPNTVGSGNNIILKKSVQDDFNKYTGAKIYESPLANLMFFLDKTKPVNEPIRIGFLTQANKDGHVNIVDKIVTAHNMAGRRVELLVSNPNVGENDKQHVVSKIKDADANRWDLAVTSASMKYETDPELAIVSTRVHTAHGTWFRKTRDSRCVSRHRQLTMTHDSLSNGAATRLVKPFLHWGLSALCFIIFLAVG